MNTNRSVEPCPICGTTRRVYLFELHASLISRCEGCELIFSAPVTQPQGSALFDERDADPGLGNETAEGYTEAEACKNYLKFLSARAPGLRSVLVVCEANHYFPAAAERLGLNVVRSLTMDEFENGQLPAEAVDAVVILYQLERSASLENALNRAYRALKMGGELLAVTLSLDSRSARLFGRSWIGWRPENRYYFDNTTVQLALWRYGFREVWLENDIRSYTLTHIRQRASEIPRTWVTRLIGGMYALLPAALHKQYFRLPSSGVIVMARKAERRSMPLLSVVLPVYNEDGTFSVLMDGLLNLNLTGIQKEIIVVESNSADRSREQVMQYQDRPEVKIVLQEKARGKGNAVRAGFENAAGDVVIIQDADLEYDLNDYETLLEPVTSLKIPFVLGARHGGRWKMRQFSQQEPLSAYLNFGHVLFTALLNGLYGQRLKDPFTMYKVFRRDCLYNLRFEFDRFDFDFELVIKLIRKGYRPVEIPVNYRSRSFAEGKKVNMIRDPFTWLRALIKYRFAKITKE